MTQNALTRPSTKRMLIFRQSFDSKYKGENMKYTVLLLLFLLSASTQAATPLYISAFKCTLDSTPSGTQMEILDFEVFFDLDELGETKIGSLVSATAATGATPPDPTELGIAVEAEFTAVSADKFTSTVVVNSGDTIDIVIDFSSATGPNDGQAELSMGTQSANYVCASGSL